MGARRGDADLRQSRLSGPARELPRDLIVSLLGSLRRKTIPHRRSFERQFPNYYCIDAESFEVIDPIVDPKVVLDPAKNNP